MSLATNPPSAAADRGDWTPAVPWLLLAGLLVRAYYAWAYALNPDEAMHATWANVTTLDEVFWQTVRSQHPPMLLLIERAMLVFGRSDFLLRAPLVLMNTAAGGFLFIWVRRVWGPNAGVATLAFVTFCPGMTSAGTELRQLGVMLFFTCGALAAFELAIERASAGWMASYTIALGLALYSHYATGIVVVALGIAVPIRLWQARTPRGLGVAWAIGQVALMALCFGLYRWHIAGQLGRGQQAFLASSLYRGGGTHAFLAASWADVWDYLAGASPWGGAFMAAFVIGLFAPVEARQRGAAVATIVLPWAISAVLALRGTYPLGGTRHVQFLLPFFAAGVGAGMAWLWRGTTRQAYAVMVVLAPLWLISSLPDNALTPVERHELAQALMFLDRDVPGDETIVIDEQTFYMLRHYRGDRQSPSLNAVGFTVERIGTRSFVVAHKSWAFDAPSLTAMLEALRNTGIASPTSWVVSTGWYRQPSWQNALPRKKRYVEFGAIRFLQVDLTTS